MKNLIDRLTPRQKSLLNMSSKTRSSFEVLAPSTTHILPFHRAGVEYMVNCPGNVLNCDDPGLGKTVQTVLFLNHEFNKIDFRGQTALIVCPPAATIVWLRHLEKWLVNQRLNFSEYHPRTNFFESNIVVASYYWVSDPSLYVAKELLNHFPYNFGVFDEFHLLKHFKSMRRKVCLSKNGLHSKPLKIVALSGTPFPNTARELYYPVSTLAPHAIDNLSRHDFSVRYTNAYKDQFGHWHYRGTKRMQELFIKLASTCMVRREESEDTKKQIASLTSGKITKKFKTPAIVVLSPNRRAKKLIKELKQFDPATYLRGDYDNEEKKHISTLREEIGLEKVGPCVEYLDDKIKQYGRIVIFAHHVEVIDKLQSELAIYGAQKLRGGQSKKKQNEIIDAFQTSKTRYPLIVSLPAFYQIITLTAAHYVAFVEWSYVWDENYQAIKRLARIGQARQVIPEFLAMHGGFCERMLLGNQNKMIMKRGFRREEF